MPPSPAEQIQFLVKLQRCSMRGCSSRPTKFAPLLPLADLSIEEGDDFGAPLPITADQISGKLIQYYWRQTAPYVAPNEAHVLQQNTGKQAAIVNIVQAARQNTATLSQQ